AGVLTGGVLPAIVHTRQSRAWAEVVPERPIANRLELQLQNIASLTVHPQRAGLGCDAQLDLQSDGPVSVHFAGCGRTETR
ncbi:MAG: hypothetical protein ABF296_02130, partial [Oceanococcaceae bacterium]